jgi:hypothetical protein
MAAGAHITLAARNTGWGRSFSTYSVARSAFFPSSSFLPKPSLLTRTPRCYAMSIIRKNRSPPPGVTRRRHSSYSENAFYSLHQRHVAISTYHSRLRSTRQCTPAMGAARQPSPNAEEARHYTTSAIPLDDANIFFRCRHHVFTPIAISTTYH